MEFELKNTICDLEVLKDKLDDLLAAHNYFGDEMFAYRDLSTKEQASYYAAGYKQSRIHHEQTNDLLTMYLEQFDKLLVKFKLLEQEKNALSHGDQTEDNA
jgi:hypothetical protein